MRQRIWMLLLCLMLLPFTAAAGIAIEAPNSVMTMRVDGEIAIDPAGKVLDYRITTPITPEMQQLLDKSVRKWTFHPVVLDGAPVAAKSRMRITLAARQAGTGYAVTVDNVTFRGDPVARDGDAAEPAPVAIAVASRVMRPPSYPKGLMRAGVEGATLLYVKVSTEGDVEDVIAVQSSLYNVRGRAAILDQARKLFEDSAIAAAKRWKFTVKASAAPTADDLTLSIPVAYMMGKRSEAEAQGQWRVELRSGKRIAPWLLAAGSAQNIGISDLDPADILPIASAFKVRDGVIGMTL